MRPISVFSTRATDYLNFVDKQIIAVRPGGPAMFIENVCQDLKVPYALNEASPMKVEIEIVNNIEKGRILDYPRPRKIFETDTQCSILVSTLLDEWQLDKSKTPLCVDIQGYARSIRHSKSNQSLTFPLDIEKDIFALKGTQLEIEILDNALVERMKKKQLIITKGIDGVTLFDTGKEYLIKGNQVTNPPETIGAGDTWFAAYVAYQCAMGLSPLDSAYKACKYTSNFLSRKKIYE